MGYVLSVWQSSFSADVNSGCKTDESVCMCMNAHEIKNNKYTTGLKNASF